GSGVRGRRAGNGYAARSCVTRGGRARTPTGGDGGREETIKREAGRAPRQKERSSGPARSGRTTGTLGRAPGCVEKRARSPDPSPPPRATRVEFLRPAPRPPSSARRRRLAFSQLAAADPPEPPPCRPFSPAQRPGLWWKQPLPRRRVNIFGEELERLLKKKYEGHWYPEKPYKGSGFRCIHIGEKVDPVIEQASKESGLDIDDVRGNLPQDLSVWIDPFEVSYQIGEKGPVKVLYVDDNNENGCELDKEIKNSFNPEAQVFMPISDPASSVSSSPSPPFGHSAAVSPTFMPRSTQPLTFTTATFAATKFGSTKMKNSGRSNKVARTSPINLGLNVNDLLKQKAVSSSMHSLYGLGLGSQQQPQQQQQPSQPPPPPPPPQQQQQQKASALSPNAKEFIFPNMQGQGSSTNGMFPGDSPLNLSPLQYSNAFDVFAAYGGLNEKSFVDGLNFSLNNMQYSNQQFQPVMAN
uniref:Transducer of ERBB2, 1 n=2 Tax=Felinae TaxID=338152 RepID=A0ABI7XMY5_FELCA